MTIRASGESSSGKMNNRGGFEASGPSWTLGAVDLGGSVVSVDFEDAFTDDLVRVFILCGV